jgi:hypothetical protein
MGTEARLPNLDDEDGEQGIGSLASFLMTFLNEKNPDHCYAVIERMRRMVAPYCDIDAPSG